MDIPSKKSDRKTPISDIASECFMLILQLRSTNNYGNPESLKARVAEMFERFERESRSAGIDNDKVKKATFALVAFLDETIISSSWNQKEVWLSDPLQIRMFDTFNAGEEFFTYLEELRQRSSVNKDVLEIYYLCLALGFKGKYQLQSPELLRRVIDDLNMELHPGLYQSIDAISPNGKPTDSVVMSSGRMMPAWIYPVSAVIIFVIFYLIMSFSATNTADQIIETLKSLLA
ncbi:MAG TPA: type IVB secretion system protein IcmH/DotU [Ignavibacteriaceae bacterium]|nr:type IVB secretion system protein IcmH/DotU [Ignavibacteriaceae bacterium]